MRSSMLGSALQMARRKPMQDPTGAGGYTAGATGIGGVMPGAMSPGGWSFAQHQRPQGDLHGVLQGALDHFRRGAPATGVMPQIDTQNIGQGAGHLMGGGATAGQGMPQTYSPIGQMPPMGGVLGGGGHPPMGGAPGIFAPHPAPTGQFPLNPGAPGGGGGAMNWMSQMGGPMTGDRPPAMHPMLSMPNAPMGGGIQPTGQFPIHGAPSGQTPPMMPPTGQVPPRPTGIPSFGSAGPMPTPTNLRTSVGRQMPGRAPV